MKVRNRAEAAKKASITNRKKFGDNYYKEIGRLGGKSHNGSGGFASQKVGSDGLTGRERAARCGKKRGAK